MDVDGATAQKASQAEAVRELEADAPVDHRPKLDVGAVAFNTEDTTLNVVQAHGGQLLTAFTDGGFQHLLAGARTSVGLKAGRYMFEVAVVENRSPAEASSASSVLTPRPRHLVRVGFSTRESALLLDDSGDSVSFDSEGFFTSDSSRKRTGERFGQGNVVAAVLNLDAQSLNANTVSLFKDGVRAAEPQALPDNLRGKVLYPALTYRNSTLRLCFGGAPLCPLPFSCHGVQDAAKADCEVAKAVVPIDAKPQVILPVALPDEGSFDWVDQFLADNRGYIEISERAIVQWATKSGMKQTAGKFGIPLVDDMTADRLLGFFLPILQRHVVVVNVKTNLLAAERRAVVQRLSAANIKTVCHVLIGEPPDGFKKRVQAALLQSKQVAEREKRNAAEQQRQAGELHRANILEVKKAPLARRGHTNGTDDDEHSGLKDESTDGKMGDGDAAGDDAAKVELTEEEKMQWFRKAAAPELQPTQLFELLPEISIPDKSEGFSDIKFVWQPEAKSKKYLSDWIEHKRLTRRLDSLQPGEWFKQQWSAWNKLVGEWKRKQATAKDVARRKAQERIKKRAADELKRRRAAIERAKAQAVGDGVQQVEAENGRESDDEQEIDPLDLDPFEVEDVNDIGNGDPLYANFAAADWALLSLRFELHLLIHSFCMDCGDPGGTTFHQTLAAYYYNKYFKRQLQFSQYGVADIAELVKLVHDTIDVDADSSAFEASLPADAPLDSFIRLAEDERRDRNRRIDDGDETAELKFGAAPSSVPSAKLFAVIRRPAATGSGAGASLPPAKPVGASPRTTPRYSPPMVLAAKRPAASSLEGLPAPKKPPLLRPVSGTFVRPAAPAYSHAYTGWY